MALPLPFLDQGNINELLQQMFGLKAPSPIEDPLSGILALHMRRMAQAQPALQPVGQQPTFEPTLQPSLTAGANPPVFEPTLQPSFAPVDPQPIFGPMLEPINTVQPGLRPAPQKQQPAIYRQEPQRGLVGLLRPRVR